MDQVKIGKFIAECRKNKKLTQAQLAEKLNITDKAISKWETGKGMPDSSIMLELCDLLGISVNELLSGEVISMENYKIKAEENLMELQERKLKAEKGLKRLSILLTIIVIISAIVHGLINYYYPENHGTGVGGALVLIFGISLWIYFCKYYEVKLK